MKNKRKISNRTYLVEISYSIIESYEIDATSEYEAKSIAFARSTSNKWDNIKQSEFVVKVK